VRKENKDSCTPNNHCMLHKPCLAKVDCRL